MFNNNFTTIEIVILLLLFVTLLLPFRLINKFNKLSFVNPLIIVSTFLSFYTFASPILRVFTKKTFERGIEFREFFIYGWVGSLVLIISIYLGYFFTTQKSYKKYRVCNLNSDQLWKIGIWLNNLGILLYSVITGWNLSSFNPFINENSGIEFLRYSGSFANYFLYAQDFLISGTILIFTSYIRTKKKGFLTFAYLIITFGLYLNEGFRYRLLLIILPMFLFYLIFNNLKSRTYLLYSSLGILCFLFFSYFYETIRNYGRGFSLQKLDNFSILDTILNSFTLSETSVFLTTSGLMSIIPSKVSYVYLYPIYKVLIHPFPSAFFNKDSGDYITNALLELYQSDSQLIGAAILNYGEYYLMFGWIGIIIGGYLLGIILKKIWIFLLIHQDEELAIPLYLVNVIFIFMIISRGYLPQQFLLYGFSTLPLTLIYIYNSKKLKTNIN